MISSPKPPDPYEQANAQAGANIDSAVANDLLNNRTEITPSGRIDYVDKGITQYTDSQGNVRDIPIRERVVTLSDGQQDLLDLTESTSKNLLQVADERAGYMKEFLPQGLDTSGLTQRAAPATAPELDTSRMSFDRMGLHGGVDGQTIRDYGYDPAQHQLSGVDAPAGLRTEVSLNKDFSGVGAGLGGGAGFGNVSGDIAGVGEGLTRSVDLSKSGGTIGGLNRDFTGERHSGAVADAGGIQRNVDYQGPGVRHDAGLERSTGNVADSGNVRRTLGVDDYATQRDDVEDAIMSRYNRHFAETENQLDQKLRAQGLVPGTEAYDRQFRQLREMQTDASMQAILAGGQEQSRLFGLDLASGQFENASQQQLFNQNLQRAQHDLNVNRQNNQTALADGQFYNAAIGQDFQQALDNATFANAAQGQAFGQNLQRTLTQMDATGRNNDLAERRARFGNDAQNLYFQQTLANAGFGNEAALSEAGFANAAQEQGFRQAAEQTAQRIAAGGVNNQAAALQNQAAVDAARLQLEAQRASNDAALAEAAFHNNATTQGLNNDLAAAGFNNEVLTGNLGLSRDAADFYNAGLAAESQRGLDLINQQNEALATNNLVQAAERSAYNEGLQSQFELDQRAAADTNAQRQAELEELAYLRNQPINEISALMSGSTMMPPQFSAPFQTGIQPVDIAGYIQNAYEAERANSAAKAHGLFGLGAALLGGISDRRLKTDIRRVGQLGGGIPVYAYKLRHNGQSGLGVMADEVRHIPGAVANVGGIDLVDYRAVLKHSGPNAQANHALAVVG